MLYRRQEPPIMDQENESKPKCKSIVYIKGFAFAQRNQMKKVKLSTTEKHLKKSTSLEAEERRGRKQADEEQKNIWILLSVPHFNSLCSLQTESSCGGRPLDLMFVIDSSRSVRPDDFERVKSFIRDVLLFLDVARDQTRVGLVQFGSVVQNEFFLNSYFEKQQMERAVRSMEHLASGTMTGLALQFTREQAFSLARGARRAARSHAGAAHRRGGDRRPAAGLCGGGSGSCTTGRDRDLRGGRRSC
ncbi:Matrilin-2 [Anabarilius grahami]|uniref:Matrilin-2 n=1 Tax=Anabarilius grahami TaxID=495550 RepID=A0A3N0Z5F8_ANAGA|nr:Matrilin-2 [Anabarilius grahami]